MEVTTPISDIDIKVSIAPDADTIKSLQVTSDCTNSWNLASKDFVDENLKSHFSDDSAHKLLVEEIRGELARFYEESGYGRITAIKDIYGNELRCDGFSKSMYGALSGYVVIAKDRVGNFEAYCSSVENLLAELKRRASDKSGFYIAGDNISIDGNVLTKTDSKFVLEGATEEFSGGVYVTRDIDDVRPHATAENSAITKALASKQWSLSNTDGSISIDENVISLNYGAIDKGDGNAIVDCNDMKSALSKKLDTFAPSYPLVSNADEISISPSTSLNYDSIDAVHSDVAKTELSKKEDIVCFSNTQFASSADGKTTIVLSEDSDDNPMSSGAIFDKVADLQNSLDTRADVLSSDYKTLDTEVVHSIYSPSVSSLVGILYGKLTDDDERIVSKAVIDEGLSKKQNVIALSDGNDTGVAFDGKTVCANLKSLSHFKDGNADVATVSSGELFALVSRGHAMSLDSYGRLTIPNADAKSFGIAKVKSATSFDVNDELLENKVIVGEIEKLNDCITADSTHVVSSDVGDSVKLSLKFADGIEKDSPLAVKSDALFKKFETTQQLKYVAGQHIGISEGLEITNDYESSPPIATVNGSQPGLTTITNVSLDSDYDEKYAQYAVLSDTVSKSLAKKQQYLDFASADFDTAVASSPHLCSYGNTDYVGKTKFPECAVNGATVFSVLSTKNDVLKFSHTDFEVNGDNIGLAHGGLAETVMKPVSGGAIYGRLEKKQKAIEFIAPIKTDSVISIEHYAVGEDEALPVDVEYASPLLDSKSPMVSFDESAFFKSSTSVVSAITAEIRGTADGLAVGKDIYSELSNKQDVLTEGENITIDEENGTISKSDTTYALPEATSSVIGGVLLSDEIAIETDKAVKSSGLFKEFAKYSDTLNAIPTQITLEQSSGKMTLAYGTVADYADGDNPVKASDFASELSKKQDELHTSGDDNLTIYVSGGSTFVSSKGIDWTPVPGTEDSIGLVYFYDKDSDSDIVTSSSYTLPSRFIKTALNAAYDFSFDTDVVSANDGTVSLIYGNAEKNPYTGTEIYDKLQTKLDVVTFADDGNFVVTQTSDEPPVSSVALSISDVVNDSDGRQLQSKKIYECMFDDVSRARNMTVVNTDSDEPSIVELSGNETVCVSNNANAVLVLPKRGELDRDIEIVRIVDGGRKGKTRPFVIYDTEKKRSFKTLTEPDTHTYSLVRSVNGMLFSEIDDGMYYYSKDDGTWKFAFKTTSDGIAANTFSDMAFFGGYYVTTSYYAGSDTFNRIQYINPSDFTVNYALNTNCIFHAIAVDEYGEKSYAVGENGVYSASATSVENWSQIAATSAMKFNSIAIGNGIIVLGGVDSGLWYSSMAEVNPTQSESTVTSGKALSVAYYGKTFYAVMNDGKIHRSTDGKNWECVFTSQSTATVIYGGCLCENGDFEAFMTHEDGTYELIESLLPMTASSITSNAIKLPSAPFSMTFHDEKFVMAIAGDNGVGYVEDHQLKDFIEWSDGYVVDRIEFPTTETAYLYVLHDVTRSLTSLSKTTLSNLDSAIDKDALLTEIVSRDIEYFVDNSIASLGDDIFAYCHNLKKVVAKSATSVGECAMLECSSLSVVKIPVATTISASAFNGLSHAETVVIDCATTIGSDAFANAATYADTGKPLDVYMRNSKKDEIVEMNGFPWGANGNVYFHGSDHFVSADKKYVDSYESH